MNGQPNRSRHIAEADPRVVEAMAKQSQALSGTVKHCQALSSCLDIVAKILGRCLHQGQLVL
jgi:hypothetical protein